MTSTTASSNAPLIRKLARWLAPLALLLAIVAGMLLAVGPLGWRAGWWHFRVALQTLMPWAAYCAIAALCVGLAAIVTGAWSRYSPMRGWIAVLAFAIGGIVAYVPWHYNGMRGMVPNDITTDLDNPPAYVAVLARRRADKSQNNGEYKPAKAEQQRRNYPDIAPVWLDLPPARAFDRALAAAKELGWTIVATDPAAGRIEASEKSRWFGFVDDIVVRVTTNGSGSRIDVRSSSRLGTGDFGVNVRRVRRYLAALREGARQP